MKNDTHEKLERFCSALLDNGDMYFSKGDEEKDLLHITQILEYQGYWSGDQYRYYFDEELNLLSTEERVFGGGGYS